MHACTPIDGTQVRITTTCIRVPVMRAHAESINLEFEKDITVEEVCACACLYVFVCVRGGGTLEFM